MVPQGTSWAIAMGGLRASFQLQPPIVLELAAGNASMLWRESGASRADPSLSESLHSLEP